MLNIYSICTYMTHYTIPSTDHTQAEHEASGMTWHKSGSLQVIGYSSGPDMLHSQIQLSFLEGYYGVGLVP